MFELWFGSGDAVSRVYTTNPTEVFVVARVVAAVLGTIAVWLTYLAGERLFGRTVALLGAAIFGVAFLPNFYSHLALNDVPTLAPVALALYGVAGVLRRGWRRDYVISGVAIGLAAATKYTGAIMLVPAGRGGRVRRRRRRRADRLAPARTGGAVRTAGIRRRQPLLGAGLLGLPGGGGDPAVAGRRRRSGQARHHREQRHRLLPVDLHLGTGLGALAGGDRGRGAAAWSASG